MVSPGRSRLGIEPGGGLVEVNAGPALHEPGDVGRFRALIGAGLDDPVGKFGAVVDVFQADVLNEADRDLVSLLGRERFDFLEERGCLIEAIGEAEGGGDGGELLAVEVSNREMVDEVAYGFRITEQDSAHEERSALLGILKIGDEFQATARIGGDDPGNYGPVDLVHWVERAFDLESAAGLLLSEPRECGVGIVLCPLV